MFQDCFVTWPRHSSGWLVSLANERLREIGNRSAQFAAFWI